MQCCRPRKWYSQILSLICTLLSPIQNLFVLWYSVSSKESNTVFRTKLRLGSNPKKAYRSNYRLRILSFSLFRSTDSIIFLPAVWRIAELCWGATLWGIKLHIATCIKQDIHHCVSCFFMQRAFINAKKNPQMNRLRFFIDRPLWLFKFFFKSVNVPSILLFVFGIPAQFSFW